MKKRNLHLKTLTDAGTKMRGAYITKSFYLEELDSGFISFVLAHISNLEYDLDYHLKEIHEDFINSNYGRQVRY